MHIRMIDMFDCIADEKSSEIAIEHNEKIITYGQLKNRAYSLANYLIQEMKLLINSPVAVFLPKDISIVVADFGILYSGNMFMNLDIKTPIERIYNVLELIKPRIIITKKEYFDLLEEIQIPLIDVDDVDDYDDSMHFIEQRKYKIIDTDPMCIINTSGSTGTPKGVVLNHRSFFDFVNWVDETFSFDGSEIIGSLSPAVFDIFDFELCMLMVKGTRIVLLDSSLALFPAKLLTEIDNRKVSFIFWVPSIMVNIANLDMLKKIPLQNLKTVWFAGEVFPTKQFLYWYDNMPDVTFVNLYGPIEITLDCTYHIIRKRPNEDTPLPIGKACRNTDILILNNDDQLCKCDEDGELCVRGTSLAMGYYNNSEKTVEVFVQNPLNNSYPELIYRTGDIVYKDANDIIHFKGRKDTLIKHMGYRIELAEIEHIVENELRIVDYCCAVYDNQNKKIVLFYESDEDISPKEFRNELKCVFPNYMLPSVFCRMEMLPRNTNGKIDRLKLKNMLREEY